MPSRARLDEALNLLAATAERALDLRSRRRVVAWGGRPGRDIQVGSPEDLRRQAILNALSPLSQAMLATSRALAELAVPMAEAILKSHAAVACAGKPMAAALEQQAAGIERLLAIRNRAEVDAALQRLANPRRRPR